MKRVCISKLQFSMLIISSITVTGHLVITSLVFQRAGRDAWLSLLIAFIPGLLTIYIISKLGEKFPRYSLTEIIENTCFKFLGRLLNFLYFCYFMLITVITLYLLMDFMTSAFMPITPRVAFLAPFLLCCGFALYLGFEDFARVNEFFLPFLILGGITASLLSMSSKDYQILRPILENGFNPVFLGSLPLTALFNELVVIGIIQHKVVSKLETLKLNILILFIITVMFIGPLTGPIATFGPVTVKDFAYPTYIQISYIKLDIIENLQPIAIFLWVIGSFGKVCLFYYASIVSLQSSLGKFSFKKLIVPIGIAISILSLYIFPNLALLKKFMTTIYIYVGVLLGLIVPFIILIMQRKK